MTWINVLLEIIEESLLQPLYFCFGDSIIDVKKTQNKVKTGLIVSTLVYSAFSATVSGLANPLVDWMGQNSTLHDDTVTYIRIELAGIVLGSLAKFLMLVMVMLEWNTMIYTTLVIQMVASVSFDYGFASQSGLDLGAFGIAYSSLATNSILFIVSMIIVTKKLNLATWRIWRDEYSFAWLKSWTKVGFYSGLDSLIRNAVYIVVVLRSMNILEEQGSYWVATTFVWSWLLIPIQPLSELLKQDVGSSLGLPENQRRHWKKILPYLVFAILSLLIWASTYPGWNWFLVNVLRADKSELVLDLLQHLVPCYAIFVFGFILNGVFYALGRTEFLVLKAVIGNVLIVVLFALFKNGIWFTNDVFGVTAIFGTSLVTGAIVTTLMYCNIVRSHPTL